MSLLDVKQNTRFLISVNVVSIFNVFFMCFIKL